MMPFWKLTFFVSLSLLLFSCAQPRPVSGGPKDVNGPKILQSIPTNFTTNFHGNEIMMEFDEYVLVPKLAAELVVSPPLKYAVEYKIKGKRVYFSIKDTLQPNTTYNFNFGDAIVDLNENNPLDSSLFVVSTGTSLDSGSISGTVKNAYTLKAVENATVLLYSPTDDSALYKGGPAYITKTDKAGNYFLNYLSHKDYKIYVLETPGSNYAYQQFTSVGFYPELANPTENNALDFFLFKEIDTSQYVSKNTSKEYFNFVLGFHSDLSEPKFEFVTTTNTQKYIIEELDLDSFMFWIEGEDEIDSVTVFISDETGYSDTAKVGLEDRKSFEKSSKKNEGKSPVMVRPNIKNGVLHYFDSLLLNASRPIKSWNLDSILFVDGTDTSNVRDLMDAQKLYLEMPYSKRGSSEDIKSIHVKYDWKPGKNYAFILYSGAVTDIIDQTNDTTFIKFKTNTFEDYGSFRFTVQVPGYTGPLYMELLDENGKFLRNYKIKSGDEIYHKLALPGKYQMRLVIDENGNDKWDTGDLEKEILPEHIVYYNGMIEIRPNWDVEETWLVSFK